jgi:hypothetical protein
MMVIVIRHIHPSFENGKKVYELHVIFQETDGKLRRWSKLRLLEEPRNTFVSTLSARLPDFSGKAILQTAIYFPKIKTLQVSGPQ